MNVSIVDMNDDREINVSIVNPNNMMDNVAGGESFYSGGGEQHHQQEFDQDHQQEFLQQDDNTEVTPN